MSHRITEKDSLVVVGEPAWHGIGKLVGDLLTASEALLASGLTWKVIEVPVFNKEGIQIEGFKGIKREDTEEVFNIVGARYQPVQNIDCFEIFDGVCGTGSAKYEVAGSLQNGRKVWILARLPYDFDVVKGDEVRSYLLLTTSHDGSLAFQMYKTPIRVVCWNTLSASLAGAREDRSKIAYFKHTVNFKNRVGQAQEILAEAKAYFDNFKAQSQELAKKQITELELEDFLARLFKTENLKSEEISTRTKNAQEDIKRLFVDGKGNQLGGVAGSRWALYNAVTEYIDHERTTRGEAENRLASSWYGSGADLRERAFELVSAR